MIELHDPKVAHLISLGGWLRGLEISERQSNWIFTRTGKGPRATRRAGRLLRGRIEDITASTGAQATF